MRPLIATLLAPLTLLACQDPIKDSGGVEAYDSDLGGVVFKGPMATGGVVTLQALNAAGEDEGDPVETTVSDNGGSYSGHLSHEGLVRVTALGTALDEATGGSTADPIQLVTYAEAVDGAQQVQVNVLTDLAHRRVETLLGSGLHAADAIRQAQDELVAAVPFGAGPPPSSDGEALTPFDAGADAGYLFALSSLLAQAGKEAEDRGEGSLPELMDGLREDLADDGAIDADVAAKIHDAEPYLDPDLATLALEAVLADAGLDQPVPDLHLALDSDQDGVVNLDDNCRYVANPDQADEAGLGWGDLCDYRILNISISNHWGCGTLASDGGVVCWEADGAPTGGTPPRPDVYPAHPGNPWGDGGYLTGSYTAVGSGDNLVCALGDEGLVCWVSALGGEVTVPGDLVTLRTSSALGCAIDAEGEVTCVSNEGETITGAPGPWADVSPFGEGAVVGVRADDGTLGWVYEGSGTATLPELLEGQFTRVSASSSGWGCALRAEDGALACFGGPLGDEAPEGSFTEVAIGADIGCAADASGELTWWADATRCPAVGGAPDKLTGLTAAGCQICGIDEQGLGQCWPRYWDAARASAE